MDELSIILTLPLANIKQTSEFIRFDCPFCSDEKGRGYFTQARRFDGYVSGCFNCGHKTNVIGMLSHFGMDVSQVAKARIDGFISSGGNFANVVKPVTKPVVATQLALPSSKDFIGLTELTTACLSYVNNRKIPTKWHSLLCYVESIKMLTGKRFTVDSDGLGILYKDEAGDIIGVVVRAFNPDFPIKYYGHFPGEHKRGDYRFLEFNADKSKPAIYVEGEIDAMSILNGVSMGTIGAWYKAIDSKLASTTSIIFMPDADLWTNSNVLMHVIRMAISGATIYIPDKQQKWKDANDALSAGFSPPKLHDHIVKNAMTGLPLKLLLGDIINCFPLTDKHDLMQVYSETYENKVKLARFRKRKFS